MKTSQTPPPQKTFDGPLDWRTLVGWLREDGVISAEEAELTTTRCA